MGCAKWPHGSGEYFYYWGRPSPTLIRRDMGTFVGQNDRKSSKFFCKQSKNRIYRVKAHDELIIFAIHGNFPKRLFRAVEAVKRGRNMQKMTFFIIQLRMGYGVRKMTARVWRVFLLLRSTFLDPYPPRYGSLSGSKWPKIIKIFYFRVCNMGCPIEWALVLAFAEHLLPKIFQVMRR